MFAPGALRKGKVPANWVQIDEALVYVHRRLRVSDGPTLMEDAYSVSDPASLGVAAVLMGRHRPGYLEAAGRQKDFLLEKAPRFKNGAISHRVEVPEVWADGVSMFPPFLAYYGVAQKNLSLVRESVRQIELYRDVLVIKEGKRKGLWRHIVGPDNPDPGAWSTGNGWAAYGMLRVRATITAGWEKASTAMTKEVAALDSYVLELLEAVIRTDDDDSGLLRNYLSEEKWWPEAAGTTLLTASAYRMVMFMEPSKRRTKLIKWADSKRKAVAAHVNDDGIVMPTVNPYGHNQELPSEGYSPEAAAFLLLMGSAWRDCVCAGVCGQDS